MTDTIEEEVAEAIYNTWRNSLAAEPQWRDVSWSEIKELANAGTHEGCAIIVNLALDEARAAIAAIIPEGSVVVPRGDLDSKFCHRCANDQIDRAKFREMFPEKEPWTPDMIQAAEGDPT